jgi:hypothetical protein
MIDTLADLKARAEAATPGPWAILDERDLEVNVGPPGTLCIVNSHGDLLLEGVDEFSDTPDADAAYIATADPATVVALIKRLERAEAAVAAAHALADDYDKVTGPCRAKYVAGNIRAALGTEGTP